MPKKIFHIDTDKDKGRGYNIYFERWEEFKKILTDKEYEICIQPDVIEEFVKEHKPIGVIRVNEHDSDGDFGNEIGVWVLREGCEPYRFNEVDQSFYLDDRVVL